MHCSPSSLDNFDEQKYFSVGKLYQKNRGHILTIKIGTTDQTEASCSLNWMSDFYLGKSLIMNWTSLLHSFHLDDRNAYADHLIWIQDERPIPRKIEGSRFYIL
jgi:hypothetical protein